jgi:WD40 repeat protein
MTETGRELFTLAGHTDSVNGCAISGDGKRAASASDDQTVEVSDLLTGECLSTLPSTAPWRPAPCRPTASLSSPRAPAVSTSSNS